MTLSGVNELQYNDSYTDFLWSVNEEWGSKRLLNWTIASIYWWVIESCSCRLHWMSIVIIHTHSTAKWCSFSLIGALSQYELATWSEYPLTRPQTRKPHAFISPLPLLLLLLFLKPRHHQAPELALLLQQQLLLSFTGTHMVAMIRHVLDVAGLAALEDLFLARLFPMQPHSSRFSFAPIFLSSRQALLCCTAPPSLPSLPLGCSLLLVDLHNHSTCLTFAINQPKINHRAIIDTHDVWSSWSSMMLMMMSWMSW